MKQSPFRSGIKDYVSLLPAQYENCVACGPTTCLERPVPSHFPANCSVYCLALLHGLFCLLPTYDHLRIHRNRAAQPNHTHWRTVYGSFCEPLTKTPDHRQASRSAGPSLISLLDGKPSDASICMPVEQPWPKASYEFLYPCFCHVTSK